jgi:urease accessory protein
MTVFDKRINRLAMLAALLLAPAMAAAHTGIAGHGSGLASGLLHPLLGIDHLFAMLAVGLWASQQKGRAMWLLPVGFVAGMLVGALLGMQGGALQLVEPGIAGSLLVLGLAIASGRQLPLAGALGVTMLFGLCHGQAHGAEMPAAVTPLLYGTGFLVTTALLHVAGVFVGQALLQRALPMLLRLVGGSVALSGVVLLAGV